MSDTSISPSSVERRDLLPVLIQALYVVAPLQILMIYAGTTELTAGMTIGALIGGMGALLIVSSRLGLSWRGDRPIIYMLLFLVLGALSTAQTIYGAPAIQRGVINMSAMLAMVLMALVVKQALIQWPHLFPHLVRIIAITTGVAGLTAIFQSFVSNVLLQPQLFDMSFINVLVGQNWWRAAPMGGLVRAQGIYGEPSALAAFMGMAFGLALMRLGFLGPKYRSDLQAVVPAWTAASVLGSVILSFSAVGYAGLFAAYLGALASRVTFTVRSIVVMVIGSVAAASILVVAALQAGDGIRDRFVDLAVFSQLGNAEQTGPMDRDTNVSVQVLFLNAYVTLQNLSANPWLGAGVGAHPFAYDAFVPQLPMASTAARLNAMDAGALGLRLLSETGILGTAMFTVAVLAAWFRVRRVVLARNSSLDPRLKALALALNSGLAGLFVAKMARGPSYYGAEFWTLFALCVAIPALASLSASAFARPRVRWEPDRPQIAPSRHS